MTSQSILMVAALVTVTSVASAADKIDFNRQIKPVIESSCLSCHGVEKPKGGLQLDTREHALKGGENKGAALMAGNFAKSPLYTSTILPPGHDDIMPPKGAPLSKEQTEMVRLWIEQGADWPAASALKQVRRIDFVKDIQPILEFQCVACHREGFAKGKLRLDVKSEAFQHSGAIVPGYSDKSLVYTSTTLPKDDEALMPPSNKGGPLPKDATETLKDWIDQGANWPEGITLSPKKADAGPAGNETATVEEIHKLILAKLDVKTEAAMKTYTNTIPGSRVNYGMVAIPSGEFVMGSPASEKDRKSEEGPQHKVKLEPFWMGQTEVTWNEFEAFMYVDEERKYKSEIKTDPAVDKVSDAVARPTKPYVEMSFGMGKDGYPAISMTQHAANKYCQWLSAKTGHFYRLPTEAEWEYACRAGTATTYSWGDDPSKVDEYAWYEKNSDFKYQKVGKKKPNPWGLYDMHGNVAEWCLDQYEPTYDRFKEALTVDPWIKATTPYPHVARGGSWDDTPDKLRSAARRHSDPSWKQQDPQLPKSIWYLTDAQFLGFRIVRPLKVPSPEDLAKYWTSGVERE